MKRRTFIQAASMVTVAPCMASAQTRYPARPITYIVPVAPGGGSDYIGRTVTNAWSGILNQTFVVENQSGGGGVLACQKTARAKPDGYTLMQGYVATLATSPATRTVPYDPINDFTPIAMIGGTPNVLVVNNALPVNSLLEFQQYVKERHGHVNYGSAGAGSLTHLLMELLQQHIGIEMTHVAYRGVAPALTDLIANQTQASFPGLAAAVPHLVSGNIKALAVTGSTRSPRFPEIPTLSELGIGGFDDVLQWYGVSGPAGMPSEIVEVLNKSLGQALESPDLLKQLEIEAVEPMRMTAQEFADYSRKDLERWIRLAKKQNINLNT